jgi:hypothetical protein
LTKNANRPPKKRYAPKAKIYDGEDICDEKRHNFRKAPRLNWFRTPDFYFTNVPHTMAGDSCEIKMWGSIPEMRVLKRCGELFENYTGKKYAM